MKKYKKDSKDMVVSGVVMGVGSSVLSKVPHTANAQTAVGNMSSFMPMMGTVSGAGAAMRMTKKMYKKKKK